MDTPKRSPDEIAVGLGNAEVADVRPLDVTGVRTVAVGTVVFAVASAVLLLLHGWLEDSGHEWWLWTCLTGTGLGLFGSEYCRRRARHHHHG